MSVIRKIIGFIPAAVPVVIIWICMTDFMSPMDSGLHPDQVPIYMWLWLIASLISGELLCGAESIPLGLVLGTVPYIAVFVKSLMPAAPETVLMTRFATAGILFYIIYALCYYVYHREADRQ